jgi:serine/threonine protein kinase
MCDDTFLRSVECPHTRYVTVRLLTGRLVHACCRCGCQIAAAKVPIPFLPTLLRAFTSPQTRCMLFRQRAVCALSQIAAASPGGVLAERELLFTGACVARALDALHTHLEHMYRNLTPERISVLDDGYVCLMDHRFAKRDDGACTTLCGSPSFFAPEMVRGDIQSYPVDWWGYGVLMFELATGDSPWGATDDDDMVVLKRISSHTSGSLAVPSHVNPQLAALLNDLLEPEVETRRGDGSVVADAWFDEISWSRLLDGELPSPLLHLTSKQLEELHLGWEEIEQPDWDAMVPPDSVAAETADEDDDHSEMSDDDHHFSFGAHGSFVATQSSGSVLSRAAAREPRQNKPSFVERVQERVEASSTK